MLCLLGIRRQQCRHVSPLIGAAVSALQFPWISYSDLWTLAGCVAVEEMGGGFHLQGACLLMPDRGPGILGLLRPVACVMQLPSHSCPAIEMQASTSIGRQASLHPPFTCWWPAAQHIFCGSQRYLVSGSSLHLSGIAGSAQGPRCAPPAGAQI